MGPSVCIRPLADYARRSPGGGEEGTEARQPRPCKLLRQAIISYINITALELFLYNYLYQCYIHYITIGRTFNMLYEYCYIYSISIQCKLCKQHLILIKL